MNITLAALAQSASAANEPGLLFVALMGMGTVMIGLVCIILLCVLMGKICGLTNGAQAKQSASSPAKADAPVSAAPNAAPIPNKGEVIAAISVALAEELGTDVSAIRIHSLRRVGAPAPCANPARGELVAAISAALAEELGTDVSAIRIHSLRKVG